MHHHNMLSNVAGVESWSGGFVRDTIQVRIQSRYLDLTGAVVGRSVLGLLISLGLFKIPAKEVRLNGAYLLLSSDPLICPSMMI